MRLVTLDRREINGRTDPAVTATVEKTVGKTKGPYHIEFPVGSRVRIANLESLENFVRNWKYHNKLEPEQLDYHDRIAKVEDAGVYHGGDELYRLEEIPGIWHEQCLLAIEG